LEVERPNPDDLSWERRDVEWEQRRLTTIQAALLLTLIYNLNGSDKIGWRYTLRAIELAKEIQLLEPPPENHSREMLCVRAYTAWGLFYWQRYDAATVYSKQVRAATDTSCSLGAFHYVQQPPVTEPPKIPLPDPLEQPKWYGELWVRYPLSQSLFPTYHGLLFKAKADFWTIINEISSLTFSPHRATSKLTVSEIFQFYQRLKAWLHNLPEPLSPAKIVLPHQLKMHMHYHHMIIDLVTPILDYAGTGSPGLSPTFTPRDIYVEAVINFETCMRIYYLRHGFEATDSFLLHFLGLLNHINMNAIETSIGSSFLESRRSTLLLLTKGIHEQSLVHFVARAILRLQVSLMRPEDVDLLGRFVEIETDKVIYGPLEQAVHTNWPLYEVGFDAKAEQRKQGRMLANSLASLSLEPRTPTQPQT
jgi:hypothetical protein